MVADRAFVPKLTLAVSMEAARSGGLNGVTSSVSPTATWLAPTGAQVQFSWTRTDTREGGGSAATETTTSLNVSQPLLRGAGLGVNLAPLRIAALQEQINRLALKSTVSETVTAVILAYRSLQQAQEQLRLAQLSAARAKSLLETNKALIDAGRMAAADIVQTQSALASQQVAVLQAEQARNSAQFALLQLLAVDLRTNVVASDPIKAEPVDILLDKAIALGFDNRMDLLAQRKALEQGRQALIVAKNNRLWNLSAVGSVEVQRGLNSVLIPGTSVSPGTSSAIGLQLSIPIGDYTLRQADIQATIAVRTAEVQLEGLQQQVEASVRDAVQAVNLSWQGLQVARQAQGYAAQALDVARQKLQAGRASNFEVLSFEDDLRLADSQALSAAISYLNALTTLDEQLGTTLDTWRINLNDE